MTTITVKERTRRRLAGYKGGNRTFDDLLNKMMDEIDLEGFMAGDLAEHHRILNDPNTEWEDGDEVIAWLKGERKEEPTVIRRGPRENRVQVGSPKAGKESDRKGTGRSPRTARRRS